jgi:hypothetical protein
MAKMPEAMMKPKAMPMMKGMGGKKGKRGM